MHKMGSYPSCTLCMNHWFTPKWDAWVFHYILRALFYRIYLLLSLWIMHNTQNTKLGFQQKARRRSFLWVIHYIGPFFFFPPNLTFSCLSLSFLGYWASCKTSLNHWVKDKNQFILRLLNLWIMHSAQIGFREPSCIHCMIHWFTPKQIISKDHYILSFFLIW